MKRETFSPIQAQQVAAAFSKHEVDYMFIGKSGAILLGYPSTTQDVDVFPRKDAENGRRIVSALIEMGFELDADREGDIVRGKDFVQIKNGPFDIDLIFAPDGIDDYDQAKARMDTSKGFPVANIRDIIASKRAAGRPRDANELPQLQAFRAEYERQFGRKS
ncbi:MAG TPA: hypothetical protein VE863_22420 [Pyrinomonadaceae bacterium]|jgi:hypothetical protein|nr:hypothetical protein [Pyrinomonadaceae bacterium]